MAEALIKRFRGFATDLPDTNNNAYAEAVRNVYERAPGELIRREGCRRAIEFKADGPVWMILPLVEPGGEYTGSGMDLLLQASGDIVGESSPRSNITPSVPITPEGGAAIDYSPVITRLVPVSHIGGAVLDIALLGRNFDAEPANPIVFSGINISRGSIVIPVESVLYVGPSLVRVRFTQDVAGGNARPRDGDTVQVTLTNPDGQSTTLDTKIVFF